MIKMQVKKGLVGKVFGRLTVIALTDKRKNAKLVYLCKCECGNEIEVISASLNCGNTKSCGCYHKLRASQAKTTHGKSTSDVYHAWQNMIRRCYDSEAKDFKNYGGRGISVCKRWLESFENFYADMGDKPNGKYSLDRIKVNKGYYKTNCRWATDKVQGNNRRNNLVLKSGMERYTACQLEEINGTYRGAVYYYKTQGLSDAEIINKIKSGEVGGVSKYLFNGEYKTLKEWAAFFGIKYDTFHGRFSRFNDISKCISPIKTKNNVEV